MSKQSKESAKYLSEKFSNLAGIMDMDMKDIKVLGDQELTTKVELAIKATKNVSAHIQNKMNDSKS